jgi:hypothetical protein
MGFMDKAKKMAEQAQSKLDEVQKDFNAKQGGGGGDAPAGEATEFDQHGRPIRPPAEPAPVDPVAAGPAAVPPAPDTVAPITPPAATGDAPTEARPPQADTVAETAPEEPRREPPPPPSGGAGLSSGDPLAG